MIETDSIHDNLGTKPKTSMENKAVIMIKQLSQMMLNRPIMGRV